MPATTRGATKRQRVSHGPILGDFDLSSCVLGRIFGFLDLKDLVRMSGCNSVIRKQVYKEHKEPWRIINFGTLPYTVTARITDRQLAALLRNCNARDTCQVIKLLGCVRLRGTGLEPLRGSCWLREADLRLVHVPSHYNNNNNNNNNSTRSVDPNIVLPILTSMPPMAQDAIPLPANSGSLGLSLVKFKHERSRENFYSQFDPRLSDWLISFHEALRSKATENQTKCGYCQGIIMNMCEAENRVWVMDLSYCELCMKYTCPDGSCVGGNCPCPSVCSGCLLQCCQPYNDPNNIKCPNHIMIHRCEGCHSDACVECFEGVACTKCSDIYCKECLDGDFCANEGCFNYYCAAEECADMCTHCEACNKDFCPDCIAEHESN